MTAERVAVILAAGESSRFRESTGLELHKSLVPITDGDSCLTRWIEFCRASAIPTVVVTGDQAVAVRSVSRKVTPTVGFVHNSRYAQDRNVVSMASFLEQNDAQSILIIEGDTAVSRSGWARIVEAMSRGRNAWFTIGPVGRGRSGGVLWACDDMEVTRLEIASTYRDDLADALKWLGVMFVCQQSVRPFRTRVRELAAINPNSYYMQPWVDQLDLFPTVVADLGLEGGKSFNDAEEYDETRLWAAERIRRDDW